MSKEKYYIKFILGYLYLGLCIPFVAAQDSSEFVRINTAERQKEMLLANAKKYAFTGNTAMVENLYREVLKIDSTCDVCYYELANILVRAGNYAEAKKYAEKAYKLDSKNSWFALLNARLCFNFREYETAQKLFRQILRFHGDKQEVWLNLAHSYEEQGLFAEAAGILDTMVLRFGETDDINYRLFGIYSNIGEHGKALEVAKKLADSYPDDERFLTLLADTYSITDNDSLAVDTYNRALKESSSFPHAYHGKAEHFRKKGLFSKYFKVMQEYTANRQIDPQVKMEYLDLVLRIPSFATYFQKDIDTLCAILTSVHPASAKVKLMQAYYFVQTNRPEVALSMFNQLVNMDETNKEAWTGLLSLEYGMRMYNQLEMSAKGAVESDPKYANFYMYSFLSLQSQRKTRQAIAVLEKGIKTADCDSVFIDNAYSVLGDAYFSINKPKKAFNYYEKALKKNAENATVLNNYAYYLSLQAKQLDKAYRMSKKAIELDGKNSSFLDTFAYILYMQGKYSEAKVFFRQAIAAGGSESAVVLEHYADTLDKLGEKHTAEIYWSQALEKADCTNHEEIKRKLRK